MRVGSRICGTRGGKSPRGRRSTTRGGRTVRWAIKRRQNSRGNSLRQPAPHFALRRPTRPHKKRTHSMRISYDPPCGFGGQTNRMVEQNRSGSYTQVVYAPTGGKLALMSGQTLQKAFVPLPGQATAVYTSSGLDHYRPSDWLGSTRLTSSPSRSVTSTTGYAPFGETYASSGTPDPSFTGINPDTVSTD